MPTSSLFSLPLRLAAFVRAYAGGGYLLLRQREKHPSKSDLLQIRANLERRQAETQQEIDTFSVTDLQDEVYLMGLQDTKIRLTSTLVLVDQLLGQPDLYTEVGMEELLRLLLRRYDEIEAASAKLPEVDDDEIDVSTLPSDEREAIEEARRLELEEFQLSAQIDLLAQLLGVSNAIRTVRKIIYSHYLDEDTVRVTRSEQLAEGYPQILSWLQGAESIKTLVLPTTDAA